MEPLVKDNRSREPGIKIPVQIVRSENFNEVLEEILLDECEIEEIFMDTWRTDSIELKNEWGVNLFRRQKFRIFDDLNGVGIIVMINSLIFLRDGRVLPCAIKLYDFVDRGWHTLDYSDHYGSFNNLD